MLHKVCLVWFACPVNKQPDSRQTALRGSLLGGPWRQLLFSFLFHTQNGRLSKLSELCLFGQKTESEADMSAFRLELHMNHLEIVSYSTRSM